MVPASATCASKTITYTYQAASNSCLPATVTPPAPTCSGTLMEGVCVNSVVKNDKPCEGTGTANDSARTLTCTQSSPQSCPSGKKVATASNGTFKCSTKKEYRCPQPIPPATSNVIVLGDNSKRLACQSYTPGTSTTTKSASDATCPSSKTQKSQQAEEPTGFDICTGANGMNPERKKCPANSSTITYVLEAVVSGPDKCSKTTTTPAVSSYGDPS
jgi:hypothetical protein